MTCGPTTSASTSSSPASATATSTPCAASGAAIEYPLTPGHEIAGVVTEVGPDVSTYKVGDRVGVGCMVDSCGECGQCATGHENFCEKKTVFTYGDKDVDGTTDPGRLQPGGRRDRAVRRPHPRRARARRAAPLLCAGITLYTPLKRWLDHAGPDAKVAIVGMGGLGHMGVKIAAAMGADVTVLSQGLSKEEDGRAFGASDYRATSDAQTFEDLAGAFDVIISTDQRRPRPPAVPVAAQAVRCVRHRRPAAAAAAAPVRCARSRATRRSPGPTSVASR